MKKLVILVILLIMSVNCFAASPKWTRVKNWEKIKRSMTSHRPGYKKYGMMDKNVIKILGKPTFERLNSNEKTFYYSTKEPYITNNGTLVYNADASISFEKRNSNKIAGSNRPEAKNKKVIYLVKGFNAPNFNEVKDVEQEKPKKIKPKVKLKKWQREISWKRIRIGMHEKSVKSILGDPGKLEYSYGDRLTGGSVSFSSKGGNENIKLVSGWTEPFWYMLKKELYVEVKKKESKEEIKKSDE